MPEVLSDEYESNRRNKHDRALIPLGECDRWQAKPGSRVKAREIDPWPHCGYVAREPVKAVGDSPANENRNFPHESDNVGQLQIAGAALRTLRK
jgi:hypothetical protein